MNHIYKSEKSAGKLSKFVFVEFVVVGEVLLPNTLFPISSIFSNILCGFAYFSTSKPRSLPNTGKRNIVSTVTTTQITAKRIVLIAGLILSSFPPERISNNPPQRINKMESIPAARTKREIIKRMNSPKSIFASKIDPVSLIAYTVE